MKTYLKNIFWLLAAMICITSCDQEEVTDVNNVITTDGKIPVRTEIIVDGVITRASSEAGYTTGDGLYDIGDDVTVTATANEGYELISFYDKKDPTKNLGSSHTLKAKVPTTFKAEFGRKHTITVTASPTEGGTVSGGGKYGYGKSCTISAIANAGYAFDGWYEGSTKISSETNYTFTVSSSRTITGKFELVEFVSVGDNGYICTKIKNVYRIQQVGTNTWNAVAYGNGRYVAVSGYYVQGGFKDAGYVTTSTDGITWITPKKLASSDNVFNDIKFLNGRFVAPGSYGRVMTSTDGINWTTSTTAGFGKQNDGGYICYGDGKYVIVSDSGWYIAESTDLVTWSNSATGGSGWAYGIIYHMGVFVALGEYDRLAYSPDPINRSTWKGIKVGEDNVHWTGITTDGKKLVMVGYSYSNSTHKGWVSTSTDGITWTTPKSICSIILRSITYSNGIFVVVASDSYVFTSNDGVNWTVLEKIKDESVNLNAICVIQ